MLEELGELCEKVGTYSVDSQGVQRVVPQLEEFKARDEYKALKEEFKVVHKQAEHMRKKGPRPDELKA